MEKPMNTPQSDVNDRVSTALRHSDTAVQRMDTLLARLVTELDTVIQRLGVLETRQQAR